MKLILSVLCTMGSFTYSDLAVAANSRDNEAVDNAVLLYDSSHLRGGGGGIKIDGRGLMTDRTRAAQNINTIKIQEGDMEIDIKEQTIDGHKVMNINIIQPELACNCKDDPSNCDSGFYCSNNCYCKFRLF